MNIKKLLLFTLLITFLNNICSEYNSYQSTNNPPANIERSRISKTTCGITILCFLVVACAIHNIFEITDCIYNENIDSCKSLLRNSFGATLIPLWA